MASSMRVGMATIVLLSFPLLAVAAGEPVSESDALRRFLEDSPQARRIPAVAQSADAAARVNAPVPNLQIAYQIEDAAGIRDQFLTFQQRLPITGQRDILRNSAAAAAVAAELAATQDLRTTAALLRAAFFEVVYREQAIARFGEGTRRLERVVEILGRREREGEGSGYDLMRAEQELSQVALLAAEAEAALAVARSRFGAFFDPVLEMDSAALVGDLKASGTPPAGETAIEQALAERGDVLALQTEVERLDLARRAARRRRFPEPTLTAGWKRVEALGLGDTGFIAALSVPIPVFDRGQVSAARATADRDRAELDLEILEREIRADVSAALARAQVARQAAERLGEDVAQRAAELRRIAELSYAEGEAGILELLDAYRTSLTAELRALAVRYEAKRAEIDLDRAIGIEVTP